MSYEPWTRPRDAEECRRRDREDRQAIVERLKRFGQEQGATLIAIRQPPPGVSGTNPGVYRHNREGYDFVFFQKADDVARTDDPPELQAGKRWRVFGHYEVLGEWAIGRYDLPRRLQEGAILYTPDGYPDRRPYNPKADPPLVAKLDRQA